jgi:hypothetical protein
MNKVPEVKVEHSRKEMNNFNNIVKFDEISNSLTQSRCLSYPPFETTDLSMKMLFSRMVHPIIIIIISYADVAYRGDTVLLYYLGKPSNKGQKT